MIATCLLGWAAPAEAGCATRDKAEYDIGTWTSGQAANGVVRSFDAPVGIRCSGPLLSLLGSNSVVARLRSENEFTLRSSGGQRISYVASVTPDGSRPIEQGGTIQYGDPVLLALLGLNGRSEADLPISFVSFKGSGLKTGTYVDTIVVDWNWKVCDGVNLLGLVCLIYQEGSGRTTIVLTMSVVEKSPTVVMSARVVHDPIRGSANPVSIPGASRIASVMVTNPDVVPLDRDSVVLTLPVHSTQRLAQSPVPGRASLYAVSQDTGRTMSVNYAAPASTGDDVEFSSDGGTTWTAVPDPDGGGVSAVRVRLRGSLQPGQSVTIEVSYKVV